MRSLLQHRTMLLAVMSFWALGASAKENEKQVSINSQFAVFAEVQPRLESPASSPHAASILLPKDNKLVSKPMEVKRTKRSLAQWLRGESVAKPEQKPVRTLKSEVILRPSNKPTSSQFSTQRVWKSSRP